MNTLHKTTQPAYDKYGNKVEAKATVQAGRSEVAEFRRDVDSASKDADAEALRAISILENAARNIERIDNRSTMTGRGEFTTSFERAIKTIALSGFRNGKITWKHHLNRLKRELYDESAQFLKD